MTRMQPMISQAKEVVQYCRFFHTERINKIFRECPTPHENFDEVPHFIAAAYLCCIAVRLSLLSLASLNCCGVLVLIKASLFWRENLKQEVCLPKQRSSDSCVQEKQARPRRVTCVPTAPT